MITIPANNIFPGVYVSIQDNSNYVEAIPGAIGFMCLLSEKGPDNKPVMVTSVSDLISKYGEPLIRRYGQGWYVAKEYLDTLGNLWVMRVLPKNATYATLALKLTQNPDVITTYKRTIKKDEKDNDVEVLTMISRKTTDDVVLTVEDLNKKPLTDLLAKVPTGKNVIFPASEINRPAEYENDITLMGAEAGNAAGEDERDGGETVFNSPILGSTTLRLDGLTLSQYAFSADYSGVSDIEIRNCRILGLSGATVEVPEEFSTQEAPVEEVEDLPFDTKTLTERSFSFVNVELEDIHTVPSMDSLLNGENNAADIIFYPYGRGEYYNRLGLKLTKARKSYDNAFILDIYELGDDSAYANLVESFTVSFDIDAKDISGSSLFIKDVLDMYSDYIKCEVSENSEYFGHYEENSEEVIARTPGDSSTKYDYETLEVNYDDLAMAEIEYLSGGKDGTMYDKNGNLDWNAEVDVDDTGKKKENMVMALSNAYCGLNVNPETGEYNDEITDTENMDFTVVFDAGWPTPVKDAIVDLCDSRQSCFGFLDNGVAAENGNRSAKHAIDKRLTDHNYNDYRVALYEPYTKLYDSFTGTYFWATPMIHVASCFTRTARDKNIWWAAAGLTRGACAGIKDYRYKLAGGYKDMFKEDELNPIMRFNQGGDCIWGNWTTQQTPSALKNIHVVLCLQYIHRVLERNLKQYVYEFNDEYTYAKIKDTVNAFLSDLASERALESFSVNVGATEYQKRNNQCKVDIDLKITGVIEIINVSLNVN